uniref:Uncharacterized protein n=1 Tax=Hyaloperonospora arabidopsidis (strain Emoy2) TaxID=559515 RepID=M4C0P9_HYAAE
MLHLTSGSILDQLWCNCRSCEALVLPTHVNGYVLVTYSGVRISSIAECPTSVISTAAHNCF